MPAVTSTNRAHLVVLIAALAVVIGSFMPWYRVLFITVNGTEGDGVITLVLGGAIAVIAALTLPGGRGWTGVVGLLLFLGTGAVAVYHVSTPEPIAEIQAGLYLVLAGSIAGVVASIVALRNQPRSHQPLPPPSVP